MDERGISIGDVNNFLEDIAGAEVLPVSNGDPVPQVVKLSTIKQYVTRENQQDIHNLINQMANKEDTTRALTNREIDAILI